MSTELRHNLDHLDSDRVKGDSSWSCCANRNIRVDLALWDLLFGHQLLTVKSWRCPAIPNGADAAVRNCSWAAQMMCGLDTLRDGP